MSDIRQGIVERLRIFEAQLRGDRRRCGWCWEPLMGRHVWRAESIASGDQYLVGRCCAGVPFTQSVSYQGR